MGLQDHYKAWTALVIDFILFASLIPVNSRAIALLKERPSYDCKCCSFWISSRGGRKPGDIFKSQEASAGIRVTAAFPQGFVSHADKTVAGHYDVWEHKEKITGGNCCECKK